MEQYDDLQLEFDLPLDEVEEDAGERAISMEEARKISEAARVHWEGTDKTVPGWYKEYLELREKGWPWRVAGYIAWASSPRIGRWPETLKDLAETVLGLRSPRVIYTWRRKHPAIDSVVSLMQGSKILMERRRDAFEALAAVATQEDYKSFNHLRLMLEMLGDYVPKSKLEVGRSGAGDELDQLSDEELRKMRGTNLTPNPFPKREGEEEGKE